jgi:IclR family transcriptional regulator, acetate operon repressor
MDTTERVIATVAFLARDREFHGVTEICTALGITKATAHRILSSLSRLNWVERDPRLRKYRMGVGATRIGLAMMSNFDLVTASAPYMFRLVELTKETVMLTMRVGLERMYLKQVPGIHEVRQTVELGKLYPLWNGAPGEAILAYLEESEINIVIDKLRDSRMKVLASGQVLVVEELRKSLEEIREKGFAVSIGKRIPGAVAVAAPIFDFNSQVIGAVSIGGPSSRFTLEVAIQTGPSVSGAAKNISMRLGNIGR